MADYEGAGDEDGGHDAASPGRDRAQSPLALTTQGGDGLPTTVADGRRTLTDVAGSAVTVERHLHKSSERNREFFLPARLIQPDTQDAKISSNSIEGCTPQRFRCNSRKKRTRNPM